MAMRKLITPALALLAWTVVVPPTAALAQSRSERQMMADIRMLQEQSQQLAITLATLGDTLKALNARLDKQDEAARKSFADQRLVIENMSGDLRVIRERTDETNVRINTLNQEIDALRQSMTQLQTSGMTPSTGVTPGAPDASLPAGASTGTTTAGQQPPSTVGLSPTRMYETAFADYAAGQWSLAITGFEQFLKTFPKSELADEAQVGIGNTHYAAGRYADAVTAYNLAIQNYPTSNKAPEAYYKRGAAQERLKDVEAARTSWEFVLKNWPESDEARLAKQNLDRLTTARKPGAQ
jgi:tol-pal system protein YbgF